MKNLITIEHTILQTKIRIFSRTFQTTLACLLASLVFISPVCYGQVGESFPPVTDAMLQDPASGDWLMWRRTLDSWGYSPLTEINQENVSRIRMVWTRDLAAATDEITPLAYNGVLYVPQANDVIEAIDAVSGDVIWSYRRDLPEDVGQWLGHTVAITATWAFMKI